MVLKLRCFSCGKRLLVDEKYGGKRGKCPTCGQLIIVPRAKKGTVLSVDYTRGTGYLPSRLGQMVDTAKSKRGKIISRGLVVLGVFVLLIAVVVKCGHRIPVVRNLVGHSTKIIEEKIEEITSEQDAAITESEDEEEEEEGQEEERQE